MVRRFIKLCLQAASGIGKADVQLYVEEVTEVKYVTMNVDVLQDVCWFCCTS